MPDTLTIYLNGRTCVVAPDISVAAALALHNDGRTRLSLSGQPRAPLCGMGVCQECRVEIDGRPHQLACQTWCRDGMHVTAAQLP